MARRACARPSLARTRPRYPVRVGDHKKHHYVPASYLAAFTAERGQEGALHVFDRLTGARRESSPRKEGYRNRFYEVPGAEPLAMERALANAETRAMPIISKMIDQQRFPADRDAQALMIAFVALQYARVPAVLESIGRTAQAVGREVHGYQQPDDAFTRRVVAAMTPEERASFVGKAPMDLGLCEDGGDLAVMPGMLAQIVMKVAELASEALHARLWLLTGC
jgi:hypothetical protein